jgi:hypothetical protein
MELARDFFAVFGFIVMFCLVSVAIYGLCDDVSIEDALNMKGDSDADQR